MCRTVRCTPPRAEQLRSAFINAGHRVSGSHANPLALKTDAPPKVVWDIIRSWVKLHPVKTPEPGSYPAAILSKSIETEGDFRRAAGAVPDSVKQGVKRFVQNPAYWGPKARHGKPLKPEQQKQQQIQAAQRRARQQEQQQKQQQTVEAGSSEAAAAASDAAASSQEQQQSQRADGSSEMDVDQQPDKQPAEPAADAEDASPPHKKARQQQPAAAAAGQ